MNDPHRWLTFVCALLAVSAAAAPTPAQDASAESVDFLRDIQPIFASRCLKCHGGDQAEGGLRLIDLEAASKELDSGLRALSPKSLDESELWRRVTTADADERMPPEGPPLTDSQLAKLKSWILAGADWPTHWAYAPLLRPSAPAIAPEYQEWARMPVDAFVLDELLRRRMTPSPEAGKPVLLRRVYFDLIGLPPTADEMQDFLADDADDAYEKVVDRLLSSPRYGERWARHWMDLVHYAETHGHDQDRPREHAWPYRDYLIRSFNVDKAYGRFVQEQIAGDALFPDDPLAIVATGMLATGPWDESSLRDIREDTLDREVARYLDRDDIVTTVMSTFASSTVHCARCHDHKFDPIAQREYYGLQAVFAATDKANRTFDPDPAVVRQRRELMQSLAELPARVERGDRTLLSPELAEPMAKWEADISGAAEKWQAVEVLDFQSTEGSALKKLDDGSLLAGGQRPEKDTYTIVARAAQCSVTAVRIEALTDESLPLSGPGRQDNGNLHLSEVRVWSMPQKDAGEARLLAIKTAAADFNQNGWSVDKAIDGNPATAWGIYPEVSQPHQAMFAFAETVAGESPAALKLELQQIHGGGHLIGRLRISTTDAAGPLTLGGDAVDPRIAAIIRVPRGERSEQQQIELAAAFLKQKLTAELDSLPGPQTVYCGTNQFTADGSFRPAQAPRQVHVLKRGSVTSPLEEALPAAPNFLPQLPGKLEIENLADEGQRRAALARWMVDPNNALAWRSIANRVWQYHFGRGLVDTPSDFGRMGAAPTHPELLDWLAVELRDDSGSLKNLHRHIVTSATYRQASAHNTAAAAIDGDNHFLWRMNRRRLDAEQIHDAVLAIAGTADYAMGGPSVKQFVQSPGVHVTPVVDYKNFSVDDPAMRRRSVYRFLFRTIPDPLMDALDCPDASQLAPRRSESITPLQALATLNDKFIVRQCEHLAARIKASSPDNSDASAQVRLAFREILARPPSDDELAAAGAHVEKHGLANVCRMLLNSNEFMFVD